MSVTTNRTTAKGDQQRWLLVWATVLSICLWFVPGAQYALYPIRFFVTLVHEGGHAVATVATLGQVQSITVYANTNGVTISRGGIYFLICMSGYLGATLFGSFVLLWSRKKGVGRRGLMALAMAVLIVTALWVHSPFSFAMGLIVTALLFTGARLLPERAAAFAMSFLAVQLCLNSVFDLRDLLWLTTNTNSQNDAVFMARDFGFTPWFWASLWAMTAAVILFGTLKAYWRDGKA